MNDFTKDMTNALFNQDKINDLFRQKLNRLSMTCLNPN